MMLSIEQKSKIYCLKQKCDKLTRFFNLLEQWTEWKKNRKIKNSEFANSLSKKKAHENKVNKLLRVRLCAWGGRFAGGWVIGSSYIFLLTFLLLSESERFQLILFFLGFLYWLIFRLVERFEIESRIKDSDSILETQQNSNFQFKFQIYSHAVFFLFFLLTKAKWNNEQTNVSGMFLV